MWRIHKLKLNFIFFFITGQTTYIPLKIKNKKLLLIDSLIPKAIYFLISFGTVYTTIKESYKWPYHNEYHAIFLVCVLLFFMISNFVALFINITDPFLSETLCALFANAIDTLEKHIKLNIPIDKFKVTFRNKILFMFGIDVIGGILKFIIVSAFLKPVAEMFLFISFLYRNAVLFHTVIYIDLMGLLLESVNKKLSDIHEGSSSLIVLDCVRHVKLVHYNLWRISKTINQKFGWILLLRLVESFVFMTATIYWIFLYTSSAFKENTLQFLRKYYMNQSLNDK